jgi:hypothetical protein
MAFLFHLETTESHVGKMLDEFADENWHENLNTPGILKQAESYRPPLQDNGETIFRRSTEFVSPLLQPELYNLSLA